MVLECVSSDRQIVGYARTFFSKAMSTMFREFFPSDKNKQFLADLIENVDQVSSLFDSRKIFADDRASDALGVALEKQIPILEKFVEYVDGLKFDGRRMPFQNALKLAIKTAIELQQFLQAEYGIPWLMLSKLVQDHLESLFSVVRALFGAECKPPPLDCMKRMNHIVINTLIQDDNFDVFSLKEILEQENKQGKLDYKGL